MQTVYESSGGRYKKQGSYILPNTKIADVNEPEFLAARSMSRQLNKCCLCWVFFQQLSLPFHLALNTLSSMISTAFTQ